MTNKLWQAGANSSLNPVVEAYTVGDDYKLDQKLLGYDIEASKAHAQMLQSIGILTSAESKKLIAALDALHLKWSQGDFVVQPEQEDCHTAIEAYLTEQLGNIGKKIHTGRSRNDQAMVMVRLYLKDQLAQISAATNQLAKAFNTASTKAGDTPMPGYTHMQKAMPTTVAAWLSAYADGFTDTQQLIDATLNIIDQNPLGSAAGFGVSLPLDKDHTTKALGFAKTQDNPLYCGISRGLFELLAVQALNPVMVLAGKFAQDMMLFTTQEFDFFSLPDSFTTGSSIMPHKHNYDLFEVMRGQAHLFGSYSQQLQSVIGGVGSGYHRDLYLSKGTTIEALETTAATIEMLELAISNLVIHSDKLAAAITPEMLSVDAIDQLVSKGVPFRDAYAQIKKGLENS